MLRFALYTDWAVAASCEQPSLWQARHSSLTLREFVMSLAKNRGVRLAYDVSGAGPDLLLIAGTSADQSLRARVRPALSEKFRIIAFDNRGSGESSASLKDYGIGDLADYTVAVLDAVGSERPYRSSGIRSRYDRTGACTHASGMGHDPLEDAPDAVISQVTRFIERT